MGETGGTQGKERHTYIHIYIHTYRILMRKPEGKMPLRKRRRILKDDIKMNIKNRTTVC